jgi:WD40 repeat protein
LTDGKTDQIRNFSTGQEESVRDVVWLKPDAKDDYHDVAVKSPDKAQEFRSRFSYEFIEALFTEETVTREVYDGQGNLQYALTDDIPYITYHDRVEPEGCDLGVFSPCGNALLSLAMAPGRVEFSPSGETFTILYGVPSLWNSKSFSFLRVYNASDGKFLMSVGGRENPVVDFAYAPNSKTIGVAYLDGSVQLWDIGGPLARFGARHMNGYINILSYTPDSQYLLIQRRDELEVRQTRDGSMLARFTATAIDMKSRIFAYHMKFIPNTDTVIGFGSWGTSVAWNVNSGATKFIIQSAPLDYYNGMWTLKPHFPEFFDVDLANNRFYINEIGHDLQTGEKVDNLSSSRHIPDGCAPLGPVSNDGKVLFTRGYDAHEGEICILNAESKEMIRTLTIIQSEPRDYFVDWLFLSPDGKQLVVTLESGVIYVYHVLP